MSKFIDAVGTVMCVVIAAFTVAAVLFWMAQCIVTVYEALVSVGWFVNADVANIC